MNNSFADWNPLEDNNSTSVPDVSNISIPVPNAGENEQSIIMPESNVHVVPTPQEVNPQVEENKNILPGTPGIELLSTSSLLNNETTPNTGDVPININPENSAMPVTQEAVQNNNPQEVVQSTVPTSQEVELLDATQNLTDLGVSSAPQEVVAKDTAPLLDPTLPNTRGIQMDSMNPDIRYNPVTGEEMNVNDVINATKKEQEIEEPKEENLKRVEIGKKIKSTWNSLLLILLFVFLVTFVIFLPEVQTKVSELFSGKKGEYIETIPTGKLVCTLEASTSNLDRNIERVFTYEKNKVKSGRFTTIVRGDITLDEDALDQLNEQCNKVKDKVSDLEGVTISCNYENGKLEERETFDYKTYSMEDVSSAYLDAGSSLVEIEYEADVDRVMTLMRQGGFTCNKEK